MKFTSKDSAERSGGGGVKVYLSSHMLAQCVWSPSTGQKGGTEKEEKYSFSGDLDLFFNHKVI